MGDVISINDAVQVMYKRELDTNSNFHAVLGRTPEGLATWLKDSSGTLLERTDFGEDLFAAMNDYNKRTVSAGRKSGRGMAATRVKPVTELPQATAVHELQEKIEDAAASELGDLDDLPANFKVWTWDMNCKRGRSDKFYRIALFERGGIWRVVTTWGRNGTGGMGRVKTYEWRGADPIRSFYEDHVDSEAQDFVDKKVTEKKHRGYIVSANLPNTSSIIVPWLRTLREAIKDKTVRVDQRTWRALR